MDLSVRTLFTLAPFLLVLSCSPRVEKWFCTTEDLEQLPEAYADAPHRPGPCREYLAYAPDTNHLDHSPLKYVRVNFHFVNSTDRSKNYNGKAGIEFAKGLLRAANHDLEKNHKMWLPHGNITPVVPTRYRYLLSPRPDDPGDEGIYFHYDDQLAYYVHKGKNRNLLDHEVIDKYGVRLDTVLNIFILPHHPDSIASNTYSASGVGVALGNAVKLAGLFENGGSYWNYRGVFNHEVGHIFGLGHTWAYNDGCDDTPRHPQKCWNRSKTPPCDTLASNNVMDYNAMQHAWTPCQIGRVHLKMATEGAAQRKFLQPNWCELHDDREIFIRDTVHWRSMKDLEGNLTIASGGQLTISCRVSLPRGARITVQPGATLILDNCLLHNACGDQWLGIEIRKAGEKTGQVRSIGDPVVRDAVHALE